MAKVINAADTASIENDRVTAGFEAIAVGYSLRYPSDLENAENICLQNNTEMYYNITIMKNYRETYVRKAEIAQLILLHQLYSLSGSHELIFQGGTALRWCYGGSRFSEDLDFVTPLGADEDFMLPKFSMDASRLTMTLCTAIFWRRGPG